MGVVRLWGEDDRPSFFCFRVRDFPLRSLRVWVGGCKAIDQVPKTISGNAPGI